MPLWDENIVKCPICDKFVAGEAMEEHMKKHDNEANEPDSGANAEVIFTVYDLPTKGDTKNYSGYEFHEKFEVMDEEQDSKEFGTLATKGIAYRHEDGQYYTFHKVVMDGDRYI